MDSRALKNAAMIGVAVVLLILGVAYYIRASDESLLAPTDESSWVYCKCLACSAEFHLNGQEIETALRSGGVGTLEDRKTMAFRCPKCNELRGARVPPPRKTVSPP